VAIRYAVCRPVDRSPTSPSARRDPVSSPDSISTCRRIGCRCCEVACAEQNGNPFEINWRKVGEIEAPSPHPAALPLWAAIMPEPACLEGCPVAVHQEHADGVGATPGRLHRMRLLHLNCPSRRAAITRTWRGGQGPVRQPPDGLAPAA
jgi:hypothetical protein